jgi:hypothetical protein
MVTIVVMYKVKQPTNRKAISILTIFCYCRSCPSECPLTKRTSFAYGGAFITNCNCKNCVCCCPSGQKWFSSTASLPTATTTGYSQSLSPKGFIFSYPWTQVDVRCFTGSADSNHFLACPPCNFGERIVWLVVSLGRLYYHANIVTLHL